jgi:hypothetical protein
MQGKRQFCILFVHAQLLQTSHNGRGSLFERVIVSYAVNLVLVKLYW